MFCYSIKSIKFPINIIFISHCRSECNCSWMYSIKEMSSGYDCAIANIKCCGTITSNFRTRDFDLGKDQIFLHTWKNCPSLLVHKLLTPAIYSFDN